METTKRSEVWDHERRMFRKWLGTLSEDEIEHVWDDLQLRIAKLSEITPDKFIICKEHPDAEAS